MIATPTHTLTPQTLADLLATMHGSTFAELDLEAGLSVVATRSRGWVVLAVEVSVV